MNDPHSHVYTQSTMVTIGEDGQPRVVENSVRKSGDVKETRRCDYSIKLNALYCISFLIFCFASGLFVMVLGKKWLLATPLATALTLLRRKGTKMVMFVVSNDL